MHCVGQVLQEINLKLKVFEQEQELAQQILLTLKIVEVSYLITNKNVAPLQIENMLHERNMISSIRILRIVHMASFMHFQNNIDLPFACNAYANVGKLILERTDPS
jgi:hypothetical protein